MRDFKHLNFIRSLVCCVCLRGPAQAAHIRKGLPAHEKGGMGMKPHDKHTVPLCHECHSLQHNRGELSFWKDMDIPISLANALFVMTGDREKAMFKLMRFSRDFRNRT